MRKYDYLIVGAGLYASVCAERLSNAGYRVLVLERRKHAGGNCYSKDMGGIDVHMYGPHVFHTSNIAVWRYITQFADFRQFTHGVYSRLINLGSELYQWPINLATINKFFMKKFNPIEAKKFISNLAKKDIGNLNPDENFENKIISIAGIALYSFFIKDYTIKQWDCHPKELSADLAKRFLIRYNYDISYFNDIITAVPLNGYDSLFKSMLKNVDVELKIDYLLDREFWNKQARRIIYTGPIDKYFNNIYGSLGWRSLKFEFIKKNIEDFQGTSIIHNPFLFPHYTRTIEFKHLLPDRKYRKKTIICNEYPDHNNDEPYYPIPTVDNQELYADYLKLASKEKNVFFGGRLAEYKYYDMDDVVEKALNDYKIYIK